MTTTQIQQTPIQPTANVLAINTPLNLLHLNPYLLKTARSLNEKLYQHKLGKEEPDTRIKNIARRDSSYITPELEIYIGENTKKHPSHLLRDIIHENGHHILTPLISKIEIYNGGLAGILRKLGVDMDGNPKLRKLFHDITNIVSDLINDTVLSTIDPEFKAIYNESDKLIKKEYEELLENPKLRERIAKDPIQILLVALEERLGEKIKNLNPDPYIKELTIEIIKETKKTVKNKTLRELYEEAKQLIEKPAYPVELLTRYISSALLSIIEDTGNPLVEVFRRAVKDTNSQLENTVQKLLTMYYVATTLLMLASKQGRGNLSGAEDFKKQLDNQGTDLEPMSDEERRKTTSIPEEVTEKALDKENPAEEILETNHMGNPEDISEEALISMYKKTTQYLGEKLKDKVLLGIEAGKTITEVKIEAHTRKIIVPFLTGGGSRILPVSMINYMVSGNPSELKTTKQITIRRATTITRRLGEKLNPPKTVSILIDTSASTYEITPTTSRILSPLPILFVESGLAIALLKSIKERYNNPDTAVNLIWFGHSVDVKPGLSIDEAIEEIRSNPVILEIATFIDEAVKRTLAVYDDRRENIILIITDLEIDPYIANIVAEMLKPLKSKKLLIVITYPGNEEAKQEIIKIMETAGVKTIYLDSPEKMEKITELFRKTLEK